MPGQDRVGLAWRPELAAGILANLDRIDLMEVIADDYAGAGGRALRALRTLAAQVPVVLHGVSLGLASSSSVDARRLDAIARVIGAVEPEAWSEHLAFVRGGGRELGHLAAPPRRQATLEGLAANVGRARAIVGSAPALENVATLIEPPGSDRDEPTWVGDAIAVTGAELLLDLHNLYANAVNFGFDAQAALGRLPLTRVRFVHLAGGAWTGAAGGERRWLDNHRHDVPPAVFDLLAELAARTPHTLSVIVERDGDYPPMERVLDELDRVRAALAAGRGRLAA
jgi:hypothetical protein